MRLFQKGISLFEILVGVSLVTVGGLLITGILISTNNVFVNQTMRVNQGLSLNQASAEITDMIKSAAGVGTVYPPSGSPQYTASQEVLILRIPAYSANGNIIDSVFDYAVITKDSVSPKILRKFVFPDPASERKSENKVLSTNLDSLAFTFFDLGNNSVPAAQAVRINFIINLADDAGSSTQESSSSSTINLKNISL